MRFLITLVFSLMLFSCVPAFANDNTDVRVAIGGWSSHFPGAEDGVINETHNIIGVEYKGYSAGYFKNSYDRDTFFIAKNWRWPLFENWNATASLGLNKGYRSCFGDDGDGGIICPHGYVGIEYDKYRLVHTLKVVPGAVVYSPEVKF